MLLSRNPLPVDADVDGEVAGCIINSDKYVLYRYMSINDAYRGRRDDWVQRVFPGAARFAFADDDTNGLSRSREGYDGLIIGGNDVTRMGRFLKANRNALAGVVKICLMCGSNAQKRAQALMAGFDDVFDIAKLHPVEAAARMAAIAARYQTAKEASSEQARIHRQLRQVADIDRLTDRERLILETILRTRGRFLSYFKIQALCSSYGHEITLENVKVIICNLRKKLNAGVRIVAKSGEGYTIIANDYLED